MQQYHRQLLNIRQKPFKLTRVLFPASASTRHGANPLLRGFDRGDYLLHLFRAVHKPIASLSTPKTKNKFLNLNSK